MRPQLNNEQRPYLGLRPVEAQWQQAEWLPNILFYYDETASRKGIRYYPNIQPEYYEEIDYDIELTQEGLMRTVTGRGKHRPITEANLFKYRPTGCRFIYDGLSEFWCIGPSDRFFLLKGRGVCYSWTEVSEWLDGYIASLPADLPAELAARCQAPVPVLSFVPGDVVAFVLSNGEGYGFCRVLLDIERLDRAGWIKEPPAHVGSFHYLKRIVTSLVIVEILKVRKAEPVLQPEELSAAGRYAPSLMSSHRIINGCLPIVAHQPVLAEHLLQLPQALEELFYSGPWGQLYQWGLVAVVIPPDEQLMQHLMVAGQEFPRRGLPLAEFDAEGMFYYPEKYFKPEGEEEFELHDLRHSRYAELRARVMQLLELPIKCSYDDFSRHFGYPTRQEIIEIQAQMPFVRPKYLW